MVTLFSYWRSTTSYRVRIALNLKGMPYKTVPINLVDGEQRREPYLKVNPIGGVPSLVLENGAVLTQSMAIIDYLEEVYPTPPLLPDDPIAAAQLRAAALIIACDIHPVNNLKVGEMLKRMGHDQTEVVTWMGDWMTRGFAAFQALLPTDTTFCFGDTPSLADICLISQLYNAHRWNVNLNQFSRLTKIEEKCLQLAAFDAARPENQPDAIQTER